MQKSTKEALFRNYKFMNAIRQNNIQEVEECLKHGANVNFPDANYLNNTPLHMAVEEENIALINILIQEKPLILKNDEGKTAVDIAKLLHRDDIIQIIENYIAEKGLKENKKEELQQTSNPKELINPNGKLQLTITCTQRDGTAGAAGQLYESKSLGLLLLNAQHIHFNEVGLFYLGTNIQGPGDFDDICLKFDSDKDPKFVFIQLKHRTTPSKGKLTIDRLFAKDKEFNLGKYFKSFLSAKKKFDDNTSEVMFHGNFDNLLKNNKIKFIIFTSAEEEFKRKKFTKDREEKSIIDVVTNLLCVNRFEKRFQFDHNYLYRNKILDIGLKPCIRKLGEILGQFIISNNDKKYKEIMRNQEIQKYHVILRQQVIDVHLGGDTGVDYVKASLKKSFIKKTYNDNEMFDSVDVNVLNILWKSLCKEIIKFQKNIISLTFKEIKKRVEKIINEPTSRNIGMLIGHTISYREEERILELINTKVVDKAKNKRPKYPLNEVERNKAIENKKIRKLNKKSYGSVDERKELNNKLQEITISPAIVDTAIEDIGIVLLENLGEFKLPVAFGNVDIKIKNQNSLNKLKESFNVLIKSCDTENVIKINEELISDTNLTNDDIKGKYGIRGLIGNILVLDSESKMIKFSDEKLESNAELIMDKIKREHPDLDRYKFDLKFSELPQLSWHNSNDEKLVCDFLDNLWFFTNQHKQDKVGQILEEKIGELRKLHQNEGKDNNLFNLSCKSVYLKYHEYVQNWWLKPKDYLSQTCQFFAKAKEDIIHEPVLTFLHLVYQGQVKGKNIVLKKELTKKLHSFNEDMIAKCHEFIETSNTFSLCVTSPVITVSMLKLIMYLGIRKQSYTCINLSYLMKEGGEYVNSMLSELVKTNIKIVVVILESVETSYEEIVKKVIDTQKKREINNIKMIFVSNITNSTQLKECLSKYDEIEDNNLKLTDLAFNSKIRFQGYDVCLNTFIPQSLKHIVLSDILCKLIDNKVIEIGKPLGIVTEDYVLTSRNLTNNIVGTRLVKSTLVKSLKDLKEKVIILSAEPGMGKTTLLTYLTKLTKRIDPFSWIIRIYFREKHILDQLKIWYEQEKEVSARQVTIFLYNLVHNDVENRSTDEKKLKHTTILGQRLLEMQLFNYACKNQNVVIICDGFDELPPKYRSCAIEMCKILKNMSLHMWISSRNYMTIINYIKSNIESTVYALQPFTSDEKRQFMVNFWKEKYNADEYNLIINSFLDIISLSEHDSDRSLLDIPLNMYLLCKYIQSEIEKSCVVVNKGTLECILKEIDLVSMYEYYIRKKIDKVIKKKYNIESFYMHEDDLETMKFATFIEDCRQEIMKNHQVLALSMIVGNDYKIPNVSAKMIKKVTKIFKYPENNSGLVVTDDDDEGNLKFIHISFAEYFVAQFVFQQLQLCVEKDRRNTKEVMDFFMDYFLMKCNRHIRRFFDSILQSCDNFEKLTKDAYKTKYIFSLLLKQVNNKEEVADGKYVYIQTALDQSILRGCYKTCSFLIKCAKSNLNTNNVHDFVNILFESNFIYVLLIKNAKELFYDIFDSIRDVSPDTVKEIHTRHLLKNDKDRDNYKYEDLFKFLKKRKNSDESRRLPVFLHYILDGTQREGCLNESHSYFKLINSTNPVITKNQEDYYKIINEDIYVNELGLLKISGEI